MININKLKRTVVVEVFGNDLSRFWEARFMPRWVPLIGGSLVGIIAAYLITHGMWYLVLPIVCIIPAAILFTSYPFVGFLIWLAIAPLFATPKTFTHLAIFWVIHRLILPTAIIVTLMPYLYRIRKEWPIRLGIAELSLLASLGFLLLSVFVLSGKGLMHNMYRLYDRFFLYYCIYILIRFTPLKEKEFKLLVWVCFFQVIFQSIVGLLANFSPQVLPPLWYHKNSEVRTVGTFEAPGRFSATLIFQGLMVYHGSNSLKNLSKGLQTTLTLSFGLVWLMLLLTYAKASWLAGILIFPGLVLAYPRQTIRLTVLSTMVFGTIGAPLLAEQLYWAGKRLEHDSTQMRMVANVAMVNMIKHSPIYGHGFNTLDEKIEDFAIKVEGFAAHRVSSHNTYLSQTAEQGIVGFLLYLFPFLFWAKNTIQCWTKMPKEGYYSRQIVLFMWMAIFYQFVVSNTADFRNSPSSYYSLGIWWASLGLIANVVYPYTIKKEEYTEMDEDDDDDDDDQENSLFSLQDSLLTR